MNEPTQVINSLFGIGAGLWAAVIALGVALTNSFVQRRAWRQDRRFGMFQFLVEQDKRLGSEEFLKYRQQYKALLAGERTEQNEEGFRELLNLFDNVGFYVDSGLLDLEDVNQFFGSFVIRMYPPAIEEISRIKREWNDPEIYEALRSLYMRIRRHHENLSKRR